MHKTQGFIIKSLLLGLLFSANASYAACADYLSNSMRQLHSQQQIDICQLVKDKPVLVVNTASHCGYTRQFKGLEALHRQYQEQGLVVIGFSSNDFNQEAKDESKAADICYVNFGVSFTMLAPSHVKGEGANAVFAMLAEKTQAPQWNFNKYLINRDGEVVEHFTSRVAPDDKNLRKAIESLL